MRFRLFMGAMMICALVAAETAPAASAAPKRVFKGKTAQKRTVRLVVRPNSTLKMLRFKARLKCRNGMVLIVDERGFVPTRIRRNGRFKDVQVGRTDEVFFRGRVRSRMVRGTIRVKDRLHKRGPRCASRWIKFRAKVRGGKRR